MPFPTNPYYEIQVIAAPAVAGGAAASVAYSQMPGVFVVNAPTGALYDTTTSPLVISPTVPGMICFVLNAQATAFRVTTGSASDPGIVVPPNSEVMLTVAGGAFALLTSTAGVGSAPFTARAVVTAALPAYTINGNVLTANAVGAPGAIFDGVTPVAGDIVLLQEGIAAAAADAGPYIVTQVGTAGLKQIMTRPTWWTSGGFIPEASKITIQEGAVFKSTQWTSWVATAVKVVGTDAPQLFPDKVILFRTLVAGTLAAPITNVPIRSATLSDVRVNRKDGAGAGLANTVGYWPTVANANGITAGQANPGTASIQVQAVLAAGTVNATDTSNVTITIVN